MSVTRVALYTANPSTTRGEATKLSASKEKIVYTNGKTVFVSCAGLFLSSLAGLMLPCSDTRYRRRCPSIHAHIRLTNPVRTPRSEYRTAVTSKTRPSHAYPRRATTVLLPTRWATVRADFFIIDASFFIHFATPHQVRIWDIVGEDQSLKGAYKVLSGKMCGLLSFCATTSLHNARSIVATISSGMVRANVSSRLATGKKSGLCALRRN